VKSACRCKHLGVCFFTLAVLGIGGLLGASSATARPVPGQYIVVLEEGASEQKAEMRAKKAGADVFLRYGDAMNGFAAHMTQSQLREVRTDADVLFVSHDRKFQRTEPATAQAVRSSAGGRGGRGDTCPLDTRSGFPTQCIPPGVDRIDGESSSTRSGDRRGVVEANVAVIDDGIDVEHPDLRVVGGVNCSNDKGGFGAISPRFYHGTGVAGMTGAVDNDFGVVGVAPGVSLWSVRVFCKQANTTASRIICGIDFVTSTRIDSDPSNDIAVANMSLGAKGTDDSDCGASNNDALHHAICNSAGAGVTYVAAAGNLANDLQKTIPAAYDEVLATTAVGTSEGVLGGGEAPCVGFRDDVVAEHFSNYATLPSDQAHTAAAPGVCIVTTVPIGLFFPDSDTDYGVLSGGTSYSSPHAAGVAALCIASGECAGLSPAQIIQKLTGDAAAYNIADPSYGFLGDPLHTADPSVYYGYLIRAGLY
jgi:subtilisin